MILVNFVCGVSGFGYKVPTNQLLFTFAKTIEMVYHLRNLNLVLPHCFLGNLIQSCISGSKSVSVVNGKTSPGGSYTTYKNWITDKGSAPLNIPMSGTIELWFDNIGRYINKQYRVNVNKMKSADVITTCIQVTLNDPTCLQEYSEFKPARNDISLSDLHTRMEEKIKKGQHDFRIYRYRFIEKVLAMVRTENDSVESKRKDIQSVNRICSKFTILLLLV